MAKSTEYALAIKIAGKIDKSLGSSVKGAKNQLGSLSTASKNIKSVAKVSGAAAAASFVAVGAAAIAAGKQLYDLGAKFDEAYDTIRIGTGATGDDLEVLKESMKDVYSSVPADMGSAATAIADYNTRLELTGDNLEDLSTQAIQASSVLGEDLGGMVESSSKAFQQWSVSEDEMSEKMDYMFKVSQSTGMGMSDLFGDMQKYGPQLQDLGYSFEDAAALIGQMEKAGVNTDEALAAMKKSVGSLAKEGIGASEGLQMYYDKIKNAGTESEAAAISAEVFGTRAGSTMSAAIRDGTLAVDDFVKSLNDSNETIGGAAWDTYDFAEKFEIMKHKAEVALEPFANEVFSALGDVLPAVGEALGAVSPLITDILGTIDFSTLSNIAAEVMPVLSNTIKQIAPVLAKILPSLMSVGSQLIQTLLPVLADLVAGVLPSLIPLIDPILQIILLLAPVLESLGPCITVMAQVLSGVLVDALEVCMPIIEGLSTTLTGVLDFVTNIFSGNWSAAWDGLVQAFSGVWDTMKAIFTAPINFIIRGLNKFIGYVNNIQVPDWVPAIGGKGINIPVIPEIQLAEGGIAMSATTALIGEGGEPEAVLPLSELDSLLTGGVGGSNENNSKVYYVTFAPVIHCNSGADAAEIEGVMDDEYAKFKSFMDQFVRDNDRVKF